MAEGLIDLETANLDEQVASGVTLVDFWATRTLKSDADSRESKSIDRGEGGDRQGRCG